MENLREKIEQNARLRKYLDLINKIVKVEYKTIAAQHLVEFDELVNIGFRPLIFFCASKKNEDEEEYNESYLATAIKMGYKK